MHFGIVLISRNGSEDMMLANGLCVELGTSFLLCSALTSHIKELFLKHPNNITKPQKKFNKTPESQKRYVAIKYAYKRLL